MGWLEGTIFSNNNHTEIDMSPFPWMCQKCPMTLLGSVMFEMFFLNILQLSII